MCPSCSEHWWFASVLAANGTNKMPHMKQDLQWIIDGLWSDSTGSTGLKAPFLRLVFWSCIAQAGHSWSSPHGPTANNGGSTQWAQNKLSLPKSGFLKFLFQTVHVPQNVLNFYLWNFQRNSMLQRDSSRLFGSRWYPVLPPVWFRGPARLWHELRGLDQRKDSSWSGWSVRLPC